MKTAQFVQLTAASALLCLGISGCNTPTEDPEVLTLRGQYVLPSEPAGAISLSELAQQLEQNAAGGASPEGPADDAVAEADPFGPVVVVGRIYAGDLEPWENGKAAFLLAELPAEGHGEGHDADNCPFCKRKAANAPTAIVRFLDQDGQVIAQDARKLFGVEKQDVVVVRGQPARGELNTLVLTAEAIHVRKN